MAKEWEFTANLKSNMVHTVQVQPDTDDVDFNLYVVDSTGNVVAEDTGPEAGAECLVSPAEDGEFTFRVDLVRGNAGFSINVSSKPDTRGPAPATRSTARSAEATQLLPDEIAEMLAAHNEWRSRYNVPPVAWSDNIAAFAQEWADHLAANGMVMQHRSPNPFGENIFWASGWPRTPTEAVHAWGSEDELYDPEQNNWWPQAAHFSQLVWDTTTEIGCGRARVGNQEMWVCNYNPRGNWLGQRPFAWPPVEDNLHQLLKSQAAAEQVIQFNPDAALQKRIFADNFVPNSSEFEFTHDGTRYVAQRGEHMGSGEVRVYFVVHGDWGNVQFVVDPDAPGR